MLIESKCRVCNDPYHKGTCTITRYVEDILSDEYDYVTCDCNEYIPFDNLQYLEWINDKRSMKI